MSNDLRHSQIMPMDRADTASSQALTMPAGGRVTRTHNGTILLGLCGVARYCSLY